MKRLVAGLAGAVVAIGVMASGAQGAEDKVLTGAKLRVMDQYTQDFYIMGFSDALGISGVVECGTIRRGAVIQQTQALISERPDEPVSLTIARAMRELGCRLVNSASAKEGA
jgi:hypothetical protein